VRDSRNRGGRSVAGLDWPCRLGAARLASSSAFSFPRTSLCPDIHLMWMVPGDELAARRSASTKYRPEPDVRFVRDLITAWLSV
jgi:hypothetical protein